MAPNELPNLHFEVKGCETLNIYKAVKQATLDSRGEKIPIVAHIKNNNEWLVTMRACDWIVYALKAFSNQLKGEKCEDIKENVTLPIEGKVVSL